MAPSLSSPLSLPRESFVVSTSSSLSILDVVQPNVHSPLASLRPYTFADRHALSIVPPSGIAATHGLVAWADSSKKTVIHLASTQPRSANTPVSRWIPPQPVTSLSFCPDGTLLLAGCDDGRAYLWEVATGKLRCSWEPHFRKVNVIRWSHDANMVATAGDDGRICIWSTVALMRSPTSPQSYSTFTSHLLPITDLAFSPSSGSTPSRAHLWSASHDGTVRVWDVRTRMLLTTFAIGGAGTQIDALEVDPTGRFAFAAVSSQTLAGGSSSSSSTARAPPRVYRIDMYRRISSSSAAPGAHSTWEAVGGEDELVSEQSNRFISLDSAGALPTGISSLCLLPSTSHLLIGTSNPAKLLYLDVKSLQVVRTVAFEGESTGSVSNVRAFYRPYVEGQDAGGKGNATTASSMENRIVASNLDRVVSNATSLEPSRDDGGDDEDEYWAVLPDTSSKDVTADLCPPSLASRSSSFPVNVSHGSASSTPSAATTNLEEKLRKAEEKAQSLQEHLTRAGEINEEMWKLAVKHGLAGSAKVQRAAGSSSSSSVDQEQEEIAEEKEEEEAAAATATKVEGEGSGTASNGHGRSDGDGKANTRANAGAKAKAGAKRRKR